MLIHDRLAVRWQASNSLLCVGLDPLPDRFPTAVGRSTDAVFPFCRAIVDATHDLACAFKPQIAHFAALGVESVLEDLIAYIQESYPDIPVILDSKRGDIGSTAEQYAREAFERYKADAVTVNPYLGWDSIAPFVDYREKGTILLCRTSNESASELQSLKLEDGEPLYAHVARLAAEQWNPHGNLGLVVGATAPEELERVRGLVGTMPILVPGLGTQGGDAERVMNAGLDSQGTGLIVNAARSILYADNSVRFADAARQEATRVRDEINQYRRLLHETR